MQCHVRLVDRHAMQGRVALRNVKAGTGQEALYIMAAKRLRNHFETFL